MFSFFHFFKSKSKSVIGIDIGSSSLKIVQLASKNGKVVLETYGELALGPYAGVEIGQSGNPKPEKIVEAIKDLIREARITTHQAAISIPYGASLISIIEMPAVAEKELAQMIPIEARKYIPVPLTEVILDWSIIPRSPSTNVAPKPVPQANLQPQISPTSIMKDSNATAPLASKPKVIEQKVDVLLVAIHKETLTRYQNIAKAAGLESGFFEIEIFSAIRSALNEDNLNHLILDIGASSSKVYILEHGVVRASHVINSGSTDVTSALAQELAVVFPKAEALKRNMSEIPAPKKNDSIKAITQSLDTIFSGTNKVLQNYQKRYNNTISDVVVLGGGARMEGLLQIAEQKLQSKVILGNPFGKTEAPEFLEKILKTTGPEFAVAVGIALRKLQES